MLLPHGAIVALADGERFELYRNAGNEAHPKLDALPTPALDVHNKGSGGRHYSSAGNPAEHLQDEDAHAAAVAEWLNGEVLGHRIDSLVVVAAPRTLGELRRHYHKQLAGKLVAELAKDLIGERPDQILDHLRDAK